jgi:acetyl-CoA carboxylase biotin carboxyl carrier protein
MANERIPRKETASSAVPLKALKKIVTIMNRAQLTELDIEQEGIKIHLRKGPAAAHPVTTTVFAPAAHAAPPVHAVIPAPAAALAAPVPAAPAENENLHTITSPMVGTFYRSPSPDAKPYVTEGSTVDESTVICIVEAMKLMNEIKAEVKGTIKKILVENAQAVEFGQPLFLVEKKG